MKEILEKYFKDEKIKYFQSSDAHKNIEGDTYLRYESRVPKILLWFGGYNGEVCLKVTDNPTELENLIKSIIY
jgi:hypothetical protein